MASYTVKPGDSWARIAGAVYGNQRWLLELAKVNGGVNRILHPGEVIDAPDFDLSQTPVITNDQWAGVPTGMTGNTVNYGNAAPAVPSFAPPAVPSFNANGGKGNKPYGPAKPPATANPWAAQFNAALPGRVSNQAPTALPQGTGYSGTAPTNGVPDAARQTGGNNVHTGAAWQGGGQVHTGAAWQGNPIPQGYLNAQAEVRGQTASTQAFARGATQGAARPTNVGDPFSGIPAAARQTGNNVHVGAAFQGGTNTNTPDQPAPTPVMDRAYIAEAARYTGIAIFDYYLNSKRPDYYMKESVLPHDVNARVAAELPFRAAGFATIDEFMLAMGYRVGPDGNWHLYTPSTTRGYTGQTTATTSGGYTDYGGGGGGGGYDGGLARYGYGSGNQGAGLVQWRISG